MKKSTVVIALLLGLTTFSAKATTIIPQNEVEAGINSPIEVNALCKAVALGDISEVQRLIEAGADVNLKSNGMLPIHYAAKYNRVELIKILITAGSKIHETCDKGYTALKHAQATNASDAELFLKRFKDKSA